MKDEALIEFAKDVLDKMEQTREWNADMLDDIATDAQQKGIAKNDGNGYFQANYE